MNNFDKALDLIKGFEKLVLKPYNTDGSGTPTIGWGNTFYENGTPVKMSDSPITVNRANDLFNAISIAMAKEVYKLITVKVTDYQFGALLSLAYNIGIQNFKTSSVLKRVNSGESLESISESFRFWNKVTLKGKKVVSNGLVLRREKEIEFYSKSSLFDLKMLIIPFLLFLYTVLIVTV
jgi:lysozyme